MNASLLAAWRADFTFGAAAVFGALLLRAMFALGGSALGTRWHAVWATAARAAWLVPLAWLPLIDDLGGALRTALYGAALIMFGQFRVPPALALIALAGVGSAAGVDWLAQSSAVFGLRWCVGGLLLAAAFGAARSEPDAPARMDAANLLFALTLAWLYLLFVDRITSWSGNLPAEALAYRAQAALAPLLLVLHGAVGVALLFRPIKRSPRALATAALVTGVALWLEACGDAGADAAGYALAAAFVAVAALGLATWRQRSAAHG